MPKAVKDHRSKKNSSSAEAHKKRKQMANASNATKAREQRWFRTDALRTRAHAGTLTDKNRKEVLALGISLE